MGDFLVTAVEELWSCDLGCRFRRFGDYLLSKFHTLSSLCLKGLGTNVAGCHRDPVWERYYGLLPFVDWGFKVEDI